MADTDTVELIKWWDVLDKLEKRKGRVRVDAALAMARECQHPDAQWLASLFPVGVSVTDYQLRRVMREQGEDVRAFFVASRVGDQLLLERAAEMGYPPAQAVMAMGTHRRELEWAEKAACAGNRVGLFLLGRFFNHGIDCTRDVPRATALFKAAADLEHPTALYWYGELAYGRLDWQRFVWQGRAAERGSNGYAFLVDVFAFAKCFERGLLCRILHTVAPVVKRHLDVAKRKVFRRRFEEDEIQSLLRVVALHEAMLERARQATHCWSIVARRCRVVKDMRLKIAKMVWQQPWEFGERESNEPEPENESEDSVQHKRARVHREEVTNP
jgi:hypothetical protein